MRATALALLALTASPTGASGQEAPPPELLSAADVVALEAPPPDHRVFYGNTPLQFGHLRLPAGPGPHPVVVFLHGGCFLSAYDIGHVGLLEDALADEGYAVWSLEYRRVGDPGGGWPGTFSDVARGVDHLRTLAGNYALDLGRVVAAGHSAGGSLALWAAARDRVPRGSEVWTEDPLPVHAVLGLAPAPDLEGLYEAGVCGNVVDGLMGGSPDDHPDRYDAVSPMRLAPIDVPQTIVIGAYDGAWGPVGRAYVERARASGDEDIQVIEAAESGHFEMIVPGTSSWTVVRDALRAMVTSLRH